MCIAVYKPQNVRMPSIDTLKTCFKNNPDGAGYMFPCNDKVLIKKGFMTFEDFYRNLSDDIDMYGDYIPYVLHFRISTQAGVRADCCHPFPLSKDMENLRRLVISSNYGVAHNGIISMTSSGFSKTITYSDTMEFIRDYLSLLIKSRDWYKDKDKKTLIERMISGSRLAIMDSKGHCELIGDWITDDGIYYSNSSYMDCRHSNCNYSYYYPSYYPDAGDDKELLLEDWEFFLNEEEMMYDLDEDYCPVSMEGDTSYCRFCMNYGKCSLVSYLD